MRSSCIGSCVPTSTILIWHDLIKASSSRFQTGKLAAFHQISIVLESARFRSWVAYITITEEWPERSIPEQNYLERVHSKSHRILQHLKETSFLPTLIEGEERPRMLLHDRCQPTKCSCIPSSLLARFRENAEIKSKIIHFANGCTKWPPQAGSCTLSAENMSYL